MDDLNQVLSEQETPAVETPATETPQPEQQQEPTGETSAPPAQTQEDPIETHRKGLNAAVTAERQRRQAAEQRAQALEAQIRQFSQQQQPKPTEDGPPDPAQYQDNPQEYWRLLARHEARQEIGALVKQNEATQAQARQMQAQQAVAARVSDMVSKGQAKYGDFDAAINAGLGPFLNDTLREVLADSEAGSDVSYWLAKNPAEAARVSALPERQMVREITRLEARVTAPPKQSIPQTLTQARDARGQFAEPASAGATPLDAILSRK